MRTRWFTTFDPSIKNGATNSKYKPKLRNAVTTTASLASQVASHNSETEIIIWANPEHVKDEFDAIQTDLLNIVPHRLFFKTIAGLKKSPLRSAINETVGFSEIDHAGKVINNLKFSEIKLNQGKDQSVLKIYPLENLHKLMDHAQLQGYLNEYQYDVLKFTYNLIDPENPSYLEDVGMVTDIKKAMIMFINQIVFHGSDYSMDIDIAERINKIKNSFFEKKIQRYTAQSPSHGFVTTHDDNDIMLASYNKTNPEFLFKAIETYYAYHQNDDHIPSERINEIRRKIKKDVLFYKTILGIDPDDPNCLLSRTDILCMIAFKDEANSVNMEPKKGSIKPYLLRSKTYRPRTAEEAAQVRQWKKNNVQSD